MKISKLFHWLYAILMLLPAFAIGVTCAYAIFNKNAYQSYYGETINEQESNYTYEMVNGKEYYLQTPIQLKQFNNNGGNLSTQISVSNLELLSQNNNDFTNIDRIGFYSSSNNLNFIMYFFKENETTASFNISSSENLKISFIYNGQTSYSNSYFLNNDIFYSITYNKDSYIDNVFYYSIDKVQESPLFNWAYDSFLATPITYITGLFGMASDHIAVMLMSYWLAISIIWLVFDMVMYVPLLVHRWIDKGVLE